MATVSTSGITAGFLGKLRTQVKAVFDAILSALTITYTAGQRKLTLATSASNPTIGTSNGHLALTSGNTNGGGVVVPKYAGNVANLEDGVLWLDTTANELKVRINGVTRTVTVT